LFTELSLVSLCTYTVCQQQQLFVLLDTACQSEDEYIETRPIQSSTGRGTAKDQAQGSDSRDGSGQEGEGEGYGPRGEGLQG
jgi:hypothetical protein